LKLKGKGKRGIKTSNEIRKKKSKKIRWRTERQKENFQKKPHKKVGNGRILRKKHQKKITGESTKQKQIRELLKREENRGRFWGGVVQKLNTQLKHFRGGGGSHGGVG